MSSRRRRVSERHPTNRDTTLSQRLPLSAHPTHMPGALSASSRPNKALADLFSCIGAGDVATAKVLLEATDRVDRAALLSATNPAGITLLQHACHAGQPDGVSMLLDKACATVGCWPLETCFRRPFFMFCLSHYNSVSWSSLARGFALINGVVVMMMLAFLTALLLFTIIPTVA